MPMILDSELSISSVIRDGDDHTLTVLMLHDDIALLEMRCKGYLQQYCLASQIRQDGNIISWFNGNYFVCDKPGDSSDAFRKAVTAMFELQTVYVLSADTTSGFWVSVHRTKDAAERALQVELDKNDHLRDEAAEEGIVLSAALYYNQLEEGYYSNAKDYYYIEEQQIEEV